MVPEENLGTVEKMLRGLVADHDPVRAALTSMPEDDEGELTDEAIAGIEIARHSIARGRTLSTDESCRRLDL